MGTSKTRMGSWLVAATGFVSASVAMAGPDPCKPIQDAIAQGEKEIANLDKQLQHCDPKPKGHSPYSQCDILSGEITGIQDNVALLESQLAKCDADNPPPTSPPSIAPFSGNRGSPEPEIAVGKRYLVQLDSSNYTFYRRAQNGDIDPNPVQSGAMTTLFADLIKQIDAQLDYPVGSGLHCDADSQKDCITQSYDSDVIYDEKHDRFWIMTALRAAVWKCNPNNFNDQSDGLTGYFRGERDAQGNITVCHPGYSQYAHRYLAIAVTHAASRVHPADPENPANGFYTWVLADNYADWPQFMVHDDYLMLNQRDMGIPLWVFDASKLRAGDQDGTVMQVPAWTYTASDFNVSAIDWVGNQETQVTLDTPLYFTKMTGDNDGLNYLLGGFGNQLVVYAIAPPPGAPHGRPVMVQPAVVDMGHPVPWNYVPAAWRNNQLYWAWESCTNDDCKRNPRTFLREYRVPVHHSLHTWNGKHAVFTTNNPGDGFQTATLGEHDYLSYQLPILNVNDHDDVVMEYARIGTLEGHLEFPSVRYAALYHDRDVFSHSVLVAEGTAPFVKNLAGAIVAPNAGGAIDVASVVIDPLDPSQVFMSHAYDNGGSFTPIITAVIPKE